MIRNQPLSDFLTEYTLRNDNNQYKPVAVGRYGIRTRDSIYTKELAKDYSKNKVIYQDTLTVGMGSVQIDIGILTEDIRYSVSPAYHTYQIRNINPAYLRYCLECRNQDMFTRFVKRGSRQGKSIDLKRWLTYEIPVFDERKQAEIVTVLDRISTQVANRQEQLELFEQLVKSRFIELFESKSWETVRVDSIMFNMRNGVSPSNVGNHPAKVLTLSAITQGDFDPNSWKDGMFETEPPIEKRVTASDFYMCRGNGNKKLVGAGVYSKENRYDLVFPDTAIAATVDLQRVCLPYLFHAWKRPSVRDQIEACARTTNGTYKINQGVISNIELFLPPIDLQEQFAAFVEQTDKSKYFIQSTIENYLLIKKSSWREKHDYN